MRELLARARQIAAGDRKAVRPLSHHGTVELATLTQGFLDMARSLAARSDFIATFAAHVSHELKSPLTSIIGAAELLRDDVGEAAMDPSARRRFLDNILGDARRLTAIVNRLRELAKAEAQPSMGVTDVNGLLDSLRASYPGLAIVAQGDLDFKLAISGENLRIVLDHLADNSARHGATRFEIGARRQGEGLLILARDDGAGVSSANRTRIFDSFFTTRRDDGGTGMGLAIVRAMLDAHGGTIELAGDAKASGAAFCLRLPLAKEGVAP
jgi:signal transduction histidine kinase